jgi:hypothetical protein
MAYVCTNEDTPEWSLVIDLDASMANLFDNDTYADFALDKVTQTQPAQYLLLEKKPIKNRIVFTLSDKDPKKGSAYYLNAGEALEKKMDFDCTLQQIDQ